MDHCSYTKSSGQQRWYCRSGHSSEPLQTYPPNVPSKRTSPNVRPNVSLQTYLSKRTSPNVSLQTYLSKRTYPNVPLHVPLQRTSPNVPTPNVPLQRTSPNVPLQTPHLQNPETTILSCKYVRLTPRTAHDGMDVSQSVFEGL